MATGGDVAGSDAVFDHVCDPCSDEQTVGAVGFCMDCEEWLCQDCLKTHRKPKPSRNHVLLTEEEMKKSTQEFKTVDNCTEKCYQHDGKRLKYFCKKHDFLGCSTCIIDDHGSCGAQRISDISKLPATKAEVQQVTTDLKKVVKQSKEIVTEVTDKLSIVEQNKFETVEAFRTYRKELVKSLDQIEITLETNCSEKEKKEKLKLQRIADKCKTIEKESLLMQNKFEDFEDGGQLCNLFVAMTKSKSKVETMKDDVNLAKGSTCVTVYRFKPTVKADGILDSLKGMGALVETNHDANETDPATIRFQHVIDIPVKAKGNSTCRITESALVADSKLVLVDRNNHKIKVVDTRKNKLLSQFKIDGTPWGVCKVTDSSVAVTVSDKDCIVFLSVNATGKLCTIKNVAVSGHCMGVDCVDDRLIVSYTSPGKGKIEIINMKGSVLQTFGDKGNDQKIFDGPQHLRVSPDKKSMYISNNSNKTVVCMNLDGTAIATYTHDQLQNPEQISIDSNGMVYVGSYSSNNVHLITPDCKKMKIILSDTDGLKTVNALTYCEITNRLYIGMANSNVIKVFQLS